MNILPMLQGLGAPAAKRLSGAILLLAFAATLPATALGNSPTIRLFPTTVVEDLKQTSSVAREMETGLQEVIGRLDQQQQLYNESKCDGAESDPGCQRLAKQLASRSPIRSCSRPWGNKP